MLAELNAVKSRLETLEGLEAFNHTFDYKKASNALSYPILTYEIALSDSVATKEENIVSILIQMRDTDKTIGNITILGIAESIRNSFLKNRVLGNKIAVDMTKKIKILPDISIPHPFFECEILLSLITDIAR